MGRYIYRRLLLIVPTLFGILLLNFLIIQAAPGGPVEQTIADIRGTHTQNTDAITAPLDGSYQGSQGLDPEFIKKIEKMYGFDQPPVTRFWRMIKNYLSFDLGHSYFKTCKVIDLICQKLPVSLSLGLWSTLLIYFISIPLGIRKALKEGTAFDTWTSSLIIMAYAVPGFLFAMVLIIFFAGGYFSWFPLRGLVSDHWHTLAWYNKITDYLWHVTLPVLSLVISGFATLTLLTKNSFMDEIHKQYVITAKAKGLNDKRVLYGHVFRNAMLIVIAGMPAAFVHIFMTGSLLIEVIFSLDGLGLLAFESTLHRDYPVVFGTLYIFTLMGLVIHIISDVTYMLIDPRIDFDKRVA